MLKEEHVSVRICNGKGPMIFDLLLRRIQYSVSRFHWEKCIIMGLISRSRDGGASYYRDMDRCSRKMGWWLV